MSEKNHRTNRKRVVLSVEQIILMMTIWIIAWGSHFTNAAPQNARKVYFKRVFIVVLENASYKKAMEQPFLAELAEKGVLFTNSYAVARPSQPNYLALVSGSTQDVNSDKLVNIDGLHIGDLLEIKGMNWKVYAEQYPGKCFLEKRSGDYVRKHVPFISFLNVQKNQERCFQHIVNSEQMDKDLEENNLPEYSLYIPDMKNSGHDTGVNYADQWLRERFSNLLEDTRFIKDSLFVVTFDEGQTFGDNQIYTVLYSKNLKKGQKINNDINHYSLLRLIEEEWDLGNLGKNDANANKINLLWDSFHRSTKRR